MGLFPFFKFKLSIKNHSVLRQLSDDRRRKVTAEKLSNSKPLENVLKSVIQNNRTLLKLFGIGNSNLNSFKPKNVADKEDKFIGKRFPTFFKFKSLTEGKELNKNVHINKRARIRFETDVTNDYLKRENSPGEVKLYIINGEERKLYENYKINLANGIATLNLHLPVESKVGDKIKFIFEVSDKTRIYNPFTNNFLIFVLKEQIDTGKPPSKPRTKFPSNQDGNKGSNNSAIQLPENIREVAQTPIKNQISWTDVPNEEFNEFSSIIAINNGQTEDIFNPNSYDWFVNVDNKFLINEIKTNPQESDITKEQYKCSLIIFGISMLYEESLRSKKVKSNGEMTFEKKLKVFSSSVSPVLIPVINEVSHMRD